MIAVIGGLGAAAAWALSTLCSSRSSRLIDPVSVVAWVMLVGLLISGPLAVLEGVPMALHGSSLASLLLAGTGNVAGLFLTYAALRVGQVSLVAPIVSTEGAIAAVIAIATGDSLSPSTAIALAVIAVGVCLAATSTPDRSGSAAVAPSRALTFAVLAALAFGVSLYAAGSAGTRLPAAWVAVSARLVGTVVLAAPLALLGRLRLSRQALPLVIVSGLCEVLGFYSFTAGARHGIAVAAVLSSQFAALAAIAAYALFKERLGRVQMTGVATVIVGVAVLGALRS